MLPAGIISAFVGIFVTPWSGGALFMWSALFVGSGGAALYSALGPKQPGEGGGGVGIFLAALFIPMGLVPLVVWLLARGRPKRTPAFPGVGLEALKATRVPRPASTPAPAAPAVDPVERLRKLGELRESGVLSPAEFEVAKARILADL
jgi:hypothetical protein